ncbi:DedA family protein [Saccharibacillus sp. CPCC 101409]|uniref:DedA family protein n=1 Tax=Saccharibacillus sp. CPCC 101409 TaxID=3058041 RepID=UPI0026714F36|nr:DedA family protein [Saccharibacillus sp. CPCC 101409]MDO3409927.1 DedA family protein [Saccharibacillus sp. CPCC 101409]
MENWITSFMNEWGYIGIFLLIALENIFPPIPSEVILTFGGFMTTQSDLHIAGVVIASTLGSVAGAGALYALGAWMKQDRMERFIEKYGRWLRLKKEDVGKAYGWFDRFGKWAVFLCRLVPLVRSLISIPAGSVRMNLFSFLLLTTLGSLLWNTVLTFIGSAVGESWESVVGHMDTFSNVVYIVLGLLLLAGAIVFFRKRSVKSRSES